MFDLRHEGLRMEDSMTETILFFPIAKQRQGGETESFVMKTDALWISRVVLAVSR